MNYMKRQQIWEMKAQNINIDIECKKGTGVNKCSIVIQQYKNLAE